MLLAIALALPIGAWAEPATVSEFQALLQRGEPSDRQALVTGLVFEDPLSPAQMLELAASLPDSQGQVLACRAYYRLSRAEDAEASCRRAVVSARQQRDWPVLSQALRLTALLVAEGGNPVAAVPIYRASYRMALQNEDRLQQALILNGLGIAGHQAGAIEESATYFGRALALAQKLGRPGLLAMVHGNLGLLHRDAGESSAALERFREALPHAQMAKNVQLILVLTAGIAECLLNAGNHSEARDIVEQALRDNSRFDDRFLSEASHVLGLVAAAQKDTVRAVRYFRRGIVQASATPFRQFRIRKDLARVMLDTGQTRAAETEIDFLIEGSGKYRALLVEGLFLKARLLYDQGRFQEAYKTRESASGSAQVLARDRNASRLAFLRAQLDADVKDREIQNLQMRERLAQSAVLSERMFRNWTLITALLVLSLVVLGWRLWIRRHDARVRRELEQEVERRARDVESQLQARRSLEQQLEHRHRLESVGRLTGGIAHDYNNLMTIVQQSCDLMRKRPAVADDPEALELVKECLHASQAAAGISRQLVAFARRQPLRPTPTLVASYLTEVRPLLERAAGADRVLTTRLEPDLRILIDPAPLTAAMINLVSNARDATEPGDLIAIEARSRTITETEPSRPAIAPGRYVEIAVLDHGKGMDSETASRCVEPFFTTKASGAGTGLGLSMVHGLASQSGGDLTIDSRPGQGTTATILLPAA